MYTEFYGFKEKPFSIVPDPTFLYLSSEHRMALTHLEYGFMDRIGFVVLTGEIGAGKTTIVKQFMNQIEADAEVAIIFNTNVSGEQLLELILHEFGVGVPDKGKPSCLHALNQFLIDKYSLGRRVLLIVDEAQNLAEDGLEEIRMLSNLQTDKEALLEIMLVGQPGLRVKLQRPSLAQLSQRVAVSYHIAPLSLEETGKYIAHRLEKAGVSGTEIFTAEAVARIFEHSGGLPRTINILCDGALVYGYADELKTIDTPVIELLLKDKKELGILPRPATDEKMPQGGKDLSTDETSGDRLKRIEGQVSQLGAIFEQLVQNHQGESEKHKDVLIHKLETEIAKERGRFDELLAQHDTLRVQFDSMTETSKAGTSGPTDEDPAVATTDSDSKEEHQPRLRWTKRMGNSLKKWFAP